MAGAGYKLFNTGDVLTAAQVNTYLQEQTIMVFDDAAARTSALSGVLAEGMVSYLKDTNDVEKYDGTSWTALGGGGASSISTWVKTASGGETSLSGNDDAAQPLSYTVGQELVFINGALQYRGTDYVATTGTSITGLTALTANDVVTVWAVSTFNIAGAIASTIIDAKGDILIGTGADTPGILSVGSNDQVLTADSSTGTGLKWATPAAGGSLVKITSNTFSGVASVTVDNVFTATYKKYMVMLGTLRAVTNTDDLQMQLRYSTSTETGANYFHSGFSYNSSNSLGTFGASAATEITLSTNLDANGSRYSFYQIYFDQVGINAYPTGFGMGLDSSNYKVSNFAFLVNQARTYTGFTFKGSTSNISGDYVVYGLVE